MRQHRNLDIKQRRADAGAKERFVALVIGVRDQSHTGRDQFRPGGDNDYIRVAGAVESDLVIGRGLFTVFELRLSHCGSKGDVPERWSVSPVRFASLQIAQERSLRNPL